MGEWGRDSLQPVEDLDGIGPRLAAELGRFGYGTVHELASLNSNQIRPLAEVVPGISAQGLRRAWLEAGFHLAGDDGGLLGAALVDAGITTLAALVSTPTERVVGIGGTGWDRERAAMLQVAAARAGMQFATLLHVVDASDAPVPEPRVEVVDSGLADRRPVVVRTGDDRGWVLAPSLRRDRGHRLSIVAGGHRRVVFARAPSPSVLRLHLRLTSPPRDVSRPLTSATVAGSATGLFDEVALAAAAEGEVFRVGERAGTKVRLVRVKRMLTIAGTVTRLVDVPAAALPPGVAQGDLVVATASTLRLPTDNEVDASARPAAADLQRG